MTELRFPGQAPSQVAKHFLDLLNDVHHIHGLFLNEISTLRARVAELEASKSPVDGGVPDVPGCAVYLVSQEGIIRSWSGGACELYGYSVEEILGQSPEVLRPSGLPPVAHRSFIPASSRLRKDGSLFEVCLHHTVLLDQQGHACGRMHIEIPLGTPKVVPEITHGRLIEGGGR